MEFRDFYVYLHSGRKAPRLEIRNTACNFYNPLDFSEEINVENVINSNQKWEVAVVRISCSVDTPYSGHKSASALRFSLRKKGENIQHIQFLPRDVNANYDQNSFLEKLKKKVEELVGKGLVEIGITDSNCLVWKSEDVELLNYGNYLSIMLGLPVVNNKGDLPEGMTVENGIFVPIKDTTNIPELNSIDFERGTGAVLLGMDGMKRGAMGMPIVGMSSFPEMSYGHESKIRVYRPCYNHIFNGLIHFYFLSEYNQLITVKSGETSVILHFRLT